MGAHDNTRLVVFKDAFLVSNSIHVNTPCVWDDAILYQ